MDELDFALELNCEGINDELEYKLFVEAEERMHQLAAGHDDLRGAAVNIREAAHAENSFLYEATVVVYARPEDFAASEKNEKPMAALIGALSAVEKQVRQKREKLGKPWKQPGKGPISKELVETELSEETS